MRIARVRGLALPALTVLAIILAACGAPQAQQTQPAAPAAQQAAPAQQPEKVTLTLKGMSAWNEQFVWLEKGFAMFQKRIKERTNGAVELVRTGGPEAIPAAQQPDALRKGIVDLLFTTASYYENAVPNAGIVMYATISPDEMEKTGGIAWLNEQHRKRVNAEFVGQITYPNYYTLYTNKRINTLEDFKGLRMRAGGPTFGSVIRQLGGEPVSMPPGDIYTALERNMIQGYTFPIVGIYSIKVEDVTKYKLMPGFWQMGLNVLMNSNRFNELTPDQQRAVKLAVQDTNRDLAKWWDEEHIPQMDAQAARQGLQVINLPESEHRKLVQLTTDAGWSAVEKQTPEEVLTLKKYFAPDLLNR